MIEAVLVLALLFLPVLIAAARGHNRTVAIVLLTFLLGWTGIGWLILLVWSVAGAAGPARRPCPFCAEPVLPAAMICPHCRSALPAAPPPAVTKTFPPLPADSPIARLKARDALRGRV